MSNPLLPLHVTDMSLDLDSRRLLSNITLTISNDGITAILGHNGAGKSLLLRALHGLINTSGGTVTWGGQSVTDARTRQQQSMVFQKPVLLRRSVERNISYVMKLPHANSEFTVAELLQLARLSNKARQPARTLSGGEQQRLAFVRALATGPSVLFLDEPTANLDPDATLWIEKLIETAAERAIKVFLVTHDIAQARRLAQEVLFIRNGRVEEHAAARQFFTHPTSTHSQSFIDGILTGSDL